MDKPIEAQGITTFDVYDFGLAAALLHLGYELIDMHTADDCKCPIFHFEDTPTIEKDAESYESGKLSVNTKHYFMAYEHILGSLYGEGHYED